MPALIYTDEEFPLATIDGRDCGACWVALELDVFRDGQWSITGTGFCTGYVRGDDGATVYPLREIVQWDLPADLDQRIRAQAMTRRQAAINAFVWDYLADEAA